MQPFVGDIAQIDLEGSLHAEGEARRPWLPPEPWWDKFVRASAAITEQLETKIARGFQAAPATVVHARKPGHGTRPIGLMTPEVRILARALASAIVPEDQRPDRSPEAYANFILSPIKAAFPGGGPHTVGSATFSHVVATDLAGFYQYVDHAILRDELDLLGADIVLTDHAMELFSEIEGRAFGLPQQFEASHWMADIYAGRLQRNLARDGYQAWRYSDDFRIAVASYTDALHAIEGLATHARDCGVLLNEAKTVTPSFMTYLLKNSNAQVDDVSGIFDPDDVDAIVITDYAPETDDQAIEEAIDTLDLVHVGPEDALGEPEPFDLRRLSGDEHRRLRRALNSCRRLEHAAALDKVLPILAFEPSLTHIVAEYLVAVGPHRPDAASAVLNDVISSFSLTRWQQAWIANTMTRLALPIPDQSPWHEWLGRLFADPRSGLAGAEAAVCLARYGALEVTSLDLRMRAEADDLDPWYFWAIAAARKTDSDNSRIDALRRESALADAVLAP